MRRRRRCSPGPAGVHALGHASRHVGRLGKGPGHARERHAEHLSPAGHLGVRGPGRDHRRHPHGQDEHHGDEGRRHGRLRRSHGEVVGEEPLLVPFEDVLPREGTLELALGVLIDPLGDEGRLREGRVRRAMWDREGGRGGLRGEARRAVLGGVGGARPSRRDTKLRGP